MDYTQKILLNSSINKSSSNENASLNINFSGNKKLLPEEDVNDSVDAYNVYIEERKKSNKFRLVVNVNPFCTNVLFNPYTEIVRDEGTSSAVCLNYLEDGMSTEDARSIVKGSFDGSTFVWNQREAIRDTQLSSEVCGFEYHCGYDIFNNHTLRQRSMTAINYSDEYSRLRVGTLESGYTEDDSIKTIYGNAYRNSFVNEAYKRAETEELRAVHRHVYVDDNFNTIDDYKRDKEGTIVPEVLPLVSPIRCINGKCNLKQNNKEYILPLHTYQNYNTKTFDESYKENLSENNGWYGFNNQMTLGSIQSNEDKDSKMELNKTINNREYCDFIDMYPGRNLFSFTPIYNESRKRLEKNWDYCITYPSRSVTESADILGNTRDFPFFTKDSSGKTAIKVYMFDEGTVDDNGTKMLTIYTICQHGLALGDTINIYKNDDLFYKSVIVKRIINKYIFQVEKDSSNMSNEWIELDDRGDGILPYYTCVSINEENDVCDYRGMESDFPGGVCPKCGGTDITVGYYPICESNRCNVDPDAQNVYFRRVVNGVECEYYVRIFSRLPNFKYKDEEVNDYTLYDDNFNNKKIAENEEPLLRRFANPTDEKCEFESHCSKLGFANTAYGDDTTEILFTDDIDTSYIRDNLGRPLSDIYLTIVKNNRGYKEWYGIHSNVPLNEAVRLESVEYSHCFGKVNASFLLSDYFKEYYRFPEINYRNLYDVRDISADLIGFNTLTTETFRVRPDEQNHDNDEIEFRNDYDYYGDICCFSPVDCDEQIIQNAMHRFNTVQRELYYLNAASDTAFTDNITVDEILNDEHTMLYSASNVGDPYDRFKRGSENRMTLEEIEEMETTERAKYLWHTVDSIHSGMTRYREGYYYQPHYRISVKTISKTLNEDKAQQFEIFEFIDTESSTTREHREVFEITTSEPNYFLINEKMVIYKRSTNEYYYLTVLEPINFSKFSCVIADESGNHIQVTDLIPEEYIVNGTWNEEDGTFTESDEGEDIAVRRIIGYTEEDEPQPIYEYLEPNDYILENINDYVIVKKNENVPDYAKLIKDGSCRYCWRDVVSNGIENDENVFPFTNGAFYINRRINFYLRRQDPWKEYLGFIGFGDYTPDGEDVRKYPNLNFYDDDNYNINEIEEC